ncbi:unnamed protein product [Linum tenue]|uniref:Uncharacterized protein n=1 Tax=Linum tenue TaxID=586396 RepID=A0AAV0JHL4_9ROSI|nr:unnamed protein product [Linum tenue]
MLPKLLLAFVALVVVMLVGTAEAQTGKAAGSRMAASLEEQVGVAGIKKMAEEFIQPAAGRIFRRKLQQRDRYITYQALRANSIPCGWKGNSYYDCSYRIRANPYTRGCTEATRCFRYTH